MHIFFFFKSLYECFNGGGGEKALELIEGGMGKESARVITLLHRSRVWPRLEYCGWLKRGGQVLWLPSFQSLVPPYRLALTLSIVQPPAVIVEGN